MIGKIYITGLIGTIGDEKGVELIDIISQVKKQPESTSFEVYINSEGGVVNTGFDIYYYLKSLGLPITTIGDNIVASIATVIFMVGKKRIVKENTNFMIHLPYTGVNYATAEEMEKFSKELKKIENKMIDFYSNQLNLNKEAIEPLLKNETYMNLNQLYDLGFVNDLNKLNIAARVFKKSNKSKINKNKMSNKNKLKEIFNKLFKEEEIVNKLIYSADEKEIHFPNVLEDEEVKVGDVATFDGKHAQGEVVGQDGIIYVFNDGVLEEIKETTEQEEESFDNDEMLEALDATVNLVLENSEKVEKLEKSILGLETEKTELKNKLELAQKTISKLKGVSPDFETEPKEKEQIKETVSAKVANWKKNKNKIKK